MEIQMDACAQGDSKTGKTGALAALADAGYRIILADFDHNPAPLLRFTKRPDLVTVVPFVDDLTVGPLGNRSDAAEGVRLADRAVAAITRFQKFCLNGNGDVGRPSEWGPDTVFAADSLTAMAQSATHKALKTNGYVTREGAHINILGQEIETALDLFLSPRIKCHRYMTAHLKLISPKAPSLYQERDEAKAAIAAIDAQIKTERAALEESAFFPNMPGIQVSRIIATKFSTALLFELKDGPKGVQRVIRTAPIKGYTIGVPAPVKDPLPSETGLVTILEALKGDTK